MSANIPRFNAGQRLGATALNRLVDAVNDNSSVLVGSTRGAQPAQLEVIELQVKALNPATLSGDQNLTCTVPGATADPNAQEWTVFLPLIYWETARPPVTYVYTSINGRAANDGSNPEESQLLTPPITVGDLIFVTERADQTFQMLGDGRMWGVNPP